MIILLPDVHTWNRIDKAIAPIVIGWNGHAPIMFHTIHLSLPPEGEQWHLDCITIYSQNSLDNISGVQREHLSEVAKNKLDELEVTHRSAAQLFLVDLLSVAPVAAARTATRCKKKEVPTSIILHLILGLLALEQLLLVPVLLPVLCAFHLQLQDLYLLDLQLLVLNLPHLVNLWLEERNR